METVRGFVRLFAGQHFRSKPDRDAESFELRRLSTYAHDDAPEAIKAALSARDSYPPDTVFYEYYWAFHYRDTQMRLVLQWLFGTLVGFCKVGQWNVIREQVKQVVAAWVVLGLALAVSAAALFWGLRDLFFNSVSWWTALKVVAGPAIAAVTWAVQPVLLGWVGDAARYFGTSPSNPVERQQIREAGIKILKRLHEQKVNMKANPDAPKVYEYDRIVVVGHSLGSVIAYDLLTHYWASISQNLNIPDASPELKAARALADLGRPTVRPGNCNDEVLRDHNAANWKKHQTSLMAAATTAWKAAKLAEGKVQLAPTALTKLLARADAETRAASDMQNFDLWRVSDLVTLGCPLTYARFLMANGAKDLDERQSQQELPTCPPVVDEYPDHVGNKSFVFFYSDVSKKQHVVPNNAAVFLLTRWTNIYLEKDPIGGPVAPIFGWGIEDIGVDTESMDLSVPSNHANKRTEPMPVSDLFGGAHLRYWNLSDDLAESPGCAKKLREIVLDGSPICQLLPLVKKDWRLEANQSRVKLRPGSNFKEVTGRSFAFISPRVDDQSYEIRLWFTDQRAELDTSSANESRFSSELTGTASRYVYVHAQPEALDAWPNALAEIRNALSQHSSSR